MTASKYKPEDYPNLWRVARTIAQCEYPDRVLNALLDVAGDVMEKDALLDLIMALPPKQQTELWDELVAKGYIREGVRQRG